MITFSLLSSLEIGQFILMRGFKNYLFFDNFMFSHNVFDLFSFLSSAETLFLSKNPSSIFMSI